MDKDKEIFTILGEMYYNLVKLKGMFEQKESENKVKDQMIKDLKDKLNANLNNRGALSDD